MQRCLARLRIALFLLFAVRADAAPYPLEGYATESSVMHGDTLQLHVRSERPRYNISIWRQARTLVFVQQVGDAVGHVPPTAAHAWEGCDWPVTNSIRVDPSWKPGAYVARLDAPNVFIWIPFVVRPRVAGTHGSILVQLSTNTWQAYNRYGGKSLYGAFEPGLEGKAERVSFHRPYNYFGQNGSGQLFSWEAPFIAFLESFGYDYEVCTNIDVHRNPALLSHYRLFCSVGHDEYYSKEMFDALERSVDAGGNLAFFSANSMWWQIRYENDEHTIVCYKSSGRDPLLHVDNARVTTNWHVPPLLRPPARLMGVYYNGSSGIPTGGYQVVDPRHWVFQGVQVDSGQTFGNPMVGFEVDARTSDSPVGLDVIARTELPDHNDADVLRPSEMVYYERTPAYGFATPHGGKVFAGGTVNYALGLMPAWNGPLQVRGRADPVARAVTVNVLDRLGGTIAAPALVEPANAVSVAGGRALLSWRAAKLHRPNAPVHYRVFWMDAAGGSGAMDTEVTTAWLPVDAAASPFRWYVQARDDWGRNATSDLRSFQVHAPVATDPALPPPFLSAKRQPDGFAILVWLEAPARGKIDIFDATGKRVRRFESIFEAGTTRTTWNLEDQAGHTLASGTYFLRARIGGHFATQKLTVLR